jgi:hypothetical protein
VGHLVEDIKYSVQVFSQWRVEFVKQDSSSAAHILAKLAIRNVIKKTWPKNFIRETVLLEQFALVA